ncbi:MAG: uroporphyrinogen-III synthase [Planctomycetes bacterium]|nr:uroporphyrinogen-III synthase [Planctomycetota bacterium]
MPNFKCAARGSRLSIAQSSASLARIKELISSFQYELITYNTTGDIDQTSSLTSNIADDFFTDVLDKAVLNNEATMAIHSAKDLPEQLHKDLACFYLPWHEDSRDAILYRRDVDLPANPVVGISSPSRNNFALKKWPGCVIKPIRGNIDGRIEQLDRGDFDIILLAVAGLKRLDFQDRIDEYVDPAELKTHELQGVLAVTYKKGNVLMDQLAALICAMSPRDGEDKISSLQPELHGELAESPQAEASKSYQENHAESSQANHAIEALKGLRILTPGTERTQQALAKPIQKLGGQAIALKLFSLESVGPEKSQWCHTLANYQWLILASAAAVKALLEVFKREGVSTENLPSLAVSGPSVAEALHEAGLKASYMPLKYTSQDLAEGMVKDLDLENTPILVPRSSASKSKLPHILKEAGSKVDVVDLYENRAIKGEDLPEYDAVAFCSPSSVYAFHESYGKKLFACTRTLSIGPVTSQALKELGVTPYVEAGTHHAEGLVVALAARDCWGETP